MPPRAVRVAASAKINLYLGVHAQKDGEGYHRVDSVMAALDLADELTIAPAERLEVVTVPALDLPQERNSAYRAAVAMGEAFGREPRFSMRIVKRIPLRAGLGGPSTDAAAAIAGICRLWGLNPRSPRVAEVARSIGADVPFFLYDSPAYLAGRGDTLRESFPPLEGMPVVLVKPREGGVDTVQAYARFDAEPQELPPLEPMLCALRSRDREEVLARVANNLAPAARACLPQIGTVLDWLRGQEGARAVEVCGSGATVFAICATWEAAERIARAAADERGWWSHAARMEKSGLSVSLV